MATENGGESHVRGLFRRKDSPFWWITFTTAQGKVRESTGTESKKLALQILSKRRASVAENRYLDRRRQPEGTVAGLLDKYLRWSGTAKRPSSSRRDGTLAQALVAKLGSMPLHSLNAQAFEAYRAQRLAEGKTRATVNREHALLRHALNLGKQWGLVEINPLSDVKSFQEHPRVRYLTETEEPKLLAACRASKSELLYHFVRLLLLTGLRDGEARSLAWEDLDEAGRALTVRESKTGPRMIPLSEAALELLREIPRTGSLVFPVGSFRHGWHLACERAGIQGLRIHDLRRTFSTRLAKAGVDLVTIGTLLGHARPGTSLMYLSTSTERLRIGVNLLTAPKQSAENEREARSVSVKNSSR